MQETKFINEADEEETRTEFFNDKNDMELRFRELEKSGHKLVKRTELSLSEKLKIKRIKKANKKNRFVKHG